MTTWRAVILNPASTRQRVLSAIVVLAIFSVLGRQLWRGWHALPMGFVQLVHYPRLGGSLACLMGALLLVSSRWGMTLRTLGEPIPWRVSVRIWFLSQLGRYLPGGVWSYVGRYHLSRGEIEKDTAIVSMVVETLLRVVSEILVFLFSLPFWFSRLSLPGWVPAVLAIGAATGLCLLHPRLLDRIRRSTWPRRLGVAQAMATLSPIPYAALLGLLAYYIVTVIVVGVAFYLLVGAVYALPLEAFPVLTGALAVSGVLGFLVPLAPGGWGVREGILALLLAQLVPSPVAIILSVVSRLWLSAAEGIWILVAFRL